MSNLYAMRRANGDWFAVEDDTRPCIPLFHSSHDAFMARLRSIEMLLFSPVALDPGLLNEIMDNKAGVEFFMVENPFANLKQSTPLKHAQVLSLITSENPPRRFKWLARPWS